MKKVNWSSIFRHPCPNRRRRNKHGQCVCWAVGVVNKAKHRCPGPSSLVKCTDRLRFSRNMLRREISSSCKARTPLATPHQLKLTGTKPKLNKQKETKPEYIFLKRNPVDHPRYCFRTAEGWVIRLQLENSLINSI